MVLVVALPRAPVVAEEVIPILMLPCKAITAALEETVFGQREQAVAEVVGLVALELEQAPPAPQAPQAPSLSLSGN